MEPIFPQLQEAMLTMNARVAHIDRISKPITSKTLPHIKWDINVQFDEYGNTSIHVGDKFTFMIGPVEGEGMIVDGSDNIDISIALRYTTANGRGVQARHNYTIKNGSFNHTMPNIIAKAMMTGVYQKFDKSAIVEIYRQHTAVVQNIDTSRLKAWY